LVKVHLMNDITDDLKIRLRTVQSISSGRRTLPCSNKISKRLSKSDCKIKHTVQVISKGGYRVSSTKVRDLLNLTRSQRTAGRLLHAMGYRYRSIEDKSIKR